MNLPFRKQKSEVQTNPIIPEMNGPVAQPSGFSRTRAMYWIRLAIVILVTLFILWLLFLGVRGLVHKVSHHSPSAPKGTVSRSTEAPSSSTPNSNSSSSTNQKSGSQGSNTQSGSTNQPQGTATAGNTANDTLANTGPGSTAAIFLVATATGVAAYQVVLRRRAE